MALEVCRALGLRAARQGWAGGPRLGGETLGVRQTSLSGRAGVALGTRAAGAMERGAADGSLAARAAQLAWIQALQVNASLLSRAVKVASAFDI